MSETTKRFNPNAFQKIDMREVWAEQRRQRRWRIALLVLAIGMIVFSLALWAMVKCAL